MIRKPAYRYNWQTSTFERVYRVVDLLRIERVHPLDYSSTVRCHTVESVSFIQKLLSRVFS